MIREEEIMSKKVANVAIIVAMHVVRIVYLWLGLGLKFRIVKYLFSSSGAAVIFVADIVSPY